MCTLQCLVIEDYKNTTVVGVNKISNERVNNLKHKRLPSAVAKSKFKT